MPTGPKKKITKRVIDALLPKERRYYIWDSEVTGFGVRVSTNGRKSFVLSYRTRGGVKRMPTVGEYGPVTLTQAREVVADMMTEIRAGGDPSARWLELRKAPDIGLLLDKFETEHIPTLKEKTQKDYKGIIVRHLRPKVGRIKVASFALSDAQKLHRSMKDTPRMANMTLAVLSSALSFAEKIGWRPVRSNPCPGVRRYPERKVHRPLAKAELATLAAVLRESETPWTFKHSRTNEEVWVTDENPRAVAAIRLIILTGMRRNEVLRLRWDEVDLERSILRLRDSKTGEKTIRLNSAAREVIKAQSRMLGNPHCFPSSKKPLAPINDAKKTWARIRHRAGLDDLRLHDLRHSFAATAAADGLSLHQIGQLLGHRNPSTTQRYSDLVDDSAAALSERVGREIAKIMDGES